jgi:hypothetical protein
MGHENAAEYEPGTVRLARGESHGVQQAARRADWQIRRQ